VAGMTRRQAQIARRRAVREKEAARDRAIAQLDKAKDTLAKARAELSRVRSGA